MDAHTRMAIVETSGALSADHSEAKGGRRTSRVRNTAFFVLKLAITIGCFWYVTRNIDIKELGPIAKSLDMAWASCALLALILQLPLAGLRWGAIVDALGVPGESTPRLAMIAISSVGIFFGQILPNPGGDAMRLWMLTRLGRTWARGITSILIDRAVGGLILLVLGFITMLFPSALTGLAGNRLLVLAMIGAIVVAGLVGFAIVPYVAPILDRWRLTRPTAYLGRAVYRVFRGSGVGLPILAAATAIHLLTILVVWLLALAQGYPLPLVDASVLFTTIAVLTLLPISVSGWGVREVAVTALLQSYGMSQAQGLFFSVSYGIFLIVASLPGAIVYALYSPKPIEAGGGSSRAA